jgi:hypothetical protein
LQRFELACFAELSLRAIQLTVWREELQSSYFMGANGPKSWHVRMGCFCAEPKQNISVNATGELYSAVG